MTNNRRIAKNSLLLYLRMFFNMFIILYSSRLILKNLGIVDFGIYNAIGGLVLIFGFLNSAMSITILRFLSYELGGKNYTKLNKLFNAIFILHIFIAIIIFISAELFAFWFLNYKLNIPHERFVAARWVFQMSLLTLIISVVQLPYNTILIAREKMNVYAFLNIGLNILKLVSILLVNIFLADKLILYCFFILLSTFIIAIINIVYCYRKYDECKFIKINDKNIFKELLNYSTWNLFATVASAISNQGTNLLLNVFFGPVVNASRAVSTQVQSSFYSFLYSFQMAINPQIIKSYASEKYSYTSLLIFKGAKFSFFLSLIIFYPIFFATDFILHLWLGNNIPDNAVGFTQLILLSVLLDSISAPINTACHATSNIKAYEVINGIIMIFNLPISYLFIKNGYPPIVVYFVSIFLLIISNIARVYLSKNLIKLSVLDFFNKVILKIFFVVLISIVPIAFFVNFFVVDNVLILIFLIVVSTVSTIISILLLGLDKIEFQFLVNKLKKSYK